MTAGGVFISYRRADKAGTAHRLRDHLLAIGPDLPVAMDAYDIPPGSNFEARIASLIRNSTVLLVVIGPYWARMRNDRGGRRLDEPLDLLRREIELAVEYGCTVVPVLVDGAAMPAKEDLPADLHSLLTGQAVELRNDIFSHDVARLFEIPELSAFKRPTNRRLLLPGLIAATVVLIVVGKVAIDLVFRPNTTTEGPVAGPAAGNPSISIKAGRDVHVRDIYTGDKVESRSR